MLKAIEEHLVSEEYELESAVRAFESANQGCQYADIDGFLPDESHPQYSSILRELIRLDMEFSWVRGNPHRLADFAARYPSIFDDPTAVQEIAYEEYRLRLGSGERPSIAEYESHFEIDCSNWPSAEASEDSANHADQNGVFPADEDGVDPTRVMIPSSMDQDIRNAAMAYTVFRLTNSLSSENPSDLAWSESILSASIAGEFFRELHDSNPDAACRLAQAAAVMPECGSRFLDFELIGELGRGTFGRVFLAKQASLADRQVALKITAEESVESRALAQMQHTHIVPVYSVHRSGPFYAVVMPYFGSATLVDLLRDIKGQETRPQSGTALVSTFNGRVRSNKAKSHQSAAAIATMRPTGTVMETDGEAVVVHDLPAPTGKTEDGLSEVLRTLGDMSYIEALLWVGARIADALAHAHERGILHRDLKPANILLTDQGPMLLDFNLAADIKGSAKASAAKLGGTLPYMAPEHLEAFRDPARSVDGRCDIYSLGVILYELLSGKRPFATPRGPIKEVLAQMIRERQIMPTSLTSLNPAVSPAVDAIISRCLQADPAKRYQSARHLQEDLNRHLNNEPLLHIPEPSLAERTAKWFRRNRTNVVRAAIAASIFAVFAMGGLIIREERDRQQAKLQNAKLAAADKQKQFAKDVRLQDVFGAFGRIHDPVELSRARQKAEEWLEGYSVLSNPSWKAMPVVADLDQEARKNLLADIGETLILLAEDRIVAARADKSGQLGLDKIQLLCDRAESCYEETPLPRVLWEIRAGKAALANNPAEAEQFRKKANQTRVDSPSDMRLLASYRLSLGQAALAIPLLRQSAEKNPQNMLVWAYLGDSYFKIARYNDAITCYSVCIALAPNVGRYRFYRGQAYLQTSDAKSALIDFSEMLNRDPRDFDALLNRAIAYQRLTDYAAALTDLQAAAALPDAPEARIHFMASEVYGKNDDKEASTREYKLGLKSACSSELDWIARGLAEMRQNDNLAALKDFDEALAINPESLASMRNKAVVLAKLPGRLADAVKVLDRAVEVYPDSVAARSARGIYLARLGKRELAVRDAQECLHLDQLPMTRYMVADIYASTSRIEPKDAEKALGNLAAAFRAGFGVDLVEKDKDLDPIRVCPEFKRLCESAQFVQEAANRIKAR